MAAGMLLMLSPASALLLLALLAPAVLVMVSDNTPGRALTRTVVLFSLAAALGPVRSFVEEGATLQVLFRMLTETRTLPAVWLCAGCGWVLNETLCAVAGLVTRLKLAAQSKAFEARLLEIRTEWEAADRPSPPG